MGIGFITLFSDSSKAEIEKELSKVREQRSKATDKIEITRLDRDIQELETALNSK